jgi:hypothetical protein
MTDDPLIKNILLAVHEDVAGLEDSFSEARAWLMALCDALTETGYPVSYSFLRRETGLWPSDGLCFWAQIGAEKDIPDVPKALFVVRMPLGGFPAVVHGPHNDKAYTKTAANIDELQAYIASVLKRPEALVLLHDSKSKKE